MSDLAWNPHHRFIMASVAEDNSFQVWMPAAHIFGEDEEEGEEDVEVE